MALIQQKSEGISVFLAAVSRAFSRGDLERVADGFLFPTTLYVGSGLIYLESAAAMCREFRIYRDNLVAKGFDRAEVQIKGRQILGEQRVKLTLDWTNHSETGVIGVVHLVAYCTRNAAREWQIELLEMPKEGQAVLAKGLSII